MYRYTNRGPACADQTTRRPADPGRAVPGRLSQVVPAHRDSPPSRRKHEAGDSRGEAFRRDPPTLLSYAALAGYAFWLYAFGPALALLQAELHFSYTLLGIYSALWAAGAALAGLTFAAFARRLQRAALLWCSAAGATAGAGLFAATHTVAVTMLGAVVLGFAGTTLLTCTQAILSDRHGERRDRALTEANVGAAACAVLAPLLLGLLQGTPASWRAAMGLPALVFAGLYLRYRHQPLPAAPAARLTAGRARLPLSCWLLATLVAAGIAVEFCLVYFGAELLTATGLRTAQAATAMSGFYLGILVRPSRRGVAHPPRRADRPAAVRLPGRHRRRVPALLAGRHACRRDRRAVPLRPRHRQSLPPLTGPHPGHRARKQRHRQRPHPAPWRRARHRRPLPARQPRRPPRTAHRIHCRASTHRGLRAPAPRRTPARAAAAASGRPSKALSSPGGTCAKSGTSTSGLGRGK